MDATDLYAFISPDGPAPGSGATVTLLANYIPMQEPASGPNYYMFSDSAMYEINIDNTGDAVADIKYQFKFKTNVANPDTFLYNTGLIDTPTSANRNVTQTYTLTRVMIDAQGNHTSSVVAQDVPTAAPYIGPGSNGDMDAYQAQANAAITTAGNTKAFVGQRDDPFFIDLAAIFDLLNISRIDGLGTGTAVDTVSGFNVSTLALQIPVTDLTNGGVEPTFGNDMGGPDAVLGIWTTVKRHKHKVLRHHNDPRNFGPLVQVGRLGLPLINEVVIPLGYKDQFNRTHPKDDLTNIAGFVVDPELSRLLNALYSVEVPPTPRADLVEVIKFLPGLLTSRTDLQPADMLRLNVSIPPTAAGSVSRLGAIAGDAGGFPNGRRPADDVVDILERVVGGGVLSMEMTSGNDTFANTSPNNALNDGVDTNDVPFMTAFPYLAMPHSGFDHSHDH